MKPYKELDYIGKKARRSDMCFVCYKCPYYSRNRICDKIDTCIYVFESGFRRGYNTRKKEDKLKNNKK